MESELIAACDCVCAVKWCVSLLEELSENHLIEVPIPVETDSQGLIDWLNNPKVSCRTRHINRKFYFIKDDFEKGNVCLKYKNTKDLEADALTKTLSKDILNKHLFEIGLI
ncbi:hypothetical protein AVEN_172646-1 [Araneus ventricosus]|uniref:Copia protein n=1 Tax=Araneus ventricosus TaxID=182803 RepID=A0A4Y2NFV1_ARAVE|nr:hypothetical protein AVEN_172646-1 [Araneus ventricosus]